MTMGYLRAVTSCVLLRLKLKPKVEKQGGSKIQGSLEG